jgi:hypothetical protein
MPATTEDCADKIYIWARIRCTDSHQLSGCGYQSANGSHGLTIGASDLASLECTWPRIRQRARGNDCWPASSGSQHGYAWLLEVRILFSGIIYHVLAL